MRDYYATKNPAYKHGKRSHPLYSVWQNMISRCHRPQDRSYHHYGARGIEVCLEWRESIDSFISYVSTLPHCSEKGYSLDRIDNNKSYELGNVKWSTQKEQVRNTRRSVIITYEGKTQHLVDWSKELDIRINTLRKRLKNNWPIEKLFEKPDKGRKRFTCKDNL